MRNKKKILLIAVVILLALVLPGFYNVLAIRHYTVETPGFAHPIGNSLIW